MITQNEWIKNSVSKKRNRFHEIVAFQIRCDSTFPQEPFYRSLGGMK